jgi:hypothetical protein
MADNYFWLVDQTATEEELRLALTKGRDKGRELPVVSIPGARTPEKDVLILERTLAILQDINSLFAHSSGSKLH